MKNKGEAVEAMVTDITEEARLAFYGQVEISREGTVLNLNAGLAAAFAVLAPREPTLTACQQEVERLTRERDEARDSAHNWRSQCEAIAVILDLHEPECLGFAGEVRSKFETAEARNAELVKALEPFARIAEAERYADTPPGSSVIVNVDRCHDARAALGGQSNG